MKKRVLVDMDGVLADVYSQFIKYEERDSGVKINIEDSEGLDEVIAFPNVNKHLHEPGFFRDLQVMENSIEVMEYLNSKYEVFILSAAMEFPNSLREKYDWLVEHFPFITWEQIIFCGSKKAVTADYMIDDYPKNLDTFRGEKLLFTQPHNQSVKNPDYKRIDSWKEIKTIL
ncbi:5'(3')-deoxyribonucleotidase [Elizabethkingia anophelis]|uniref:5' nucleotidase, NT5C type n=1 Tax=Elizabethkingia anophelis TaxID=1117645 RepID=UPI0005310329|nr:5'(3')-deoxyribonucleotidase [Elizabethkingia anophelis]KGT08195.1 5'-nucleotidase [Elizabethkingia anophelis]MCT4287474.1 5'(3')-deoxyribonucleotidase [Elizabethkingia anophelis]MDV3568723.1 5'(3')-deoxyribonucleotidase [Elizabethkingia anophelis]MDV3970358.1 5'(3')-deoxyribonucleotidase [Elizabethkingia anophelis]OPC33035.1 5'(3')-deoxyribonucleotidase [Elizabethkingia anophelis]